MTIIERKESIFLEPFDDAAFLNIVKNLLSVKWTDSLADWERASASLPLEPVKKVDSVRSDYLWHGGETFELNVFHDKIVLDFVNVDLGYFELEYSSDLDDEYNHEVGIFEAAFREGVTTLTNHLGAPAFRGAWGTHGFPEEESAENIAIWRIDSAELRLGIAINKRDEPMFLFLRIIPPPVVVTDIFGITNTGKTENNGRFTFRLPSW
jgi:hypothetical protein